MQTLQQTKEYEPSIPYLIFLREAIKGGYKPTTEEKDLLKKFRIKAVKAHPKVGFTQMPKEVAVQVEGH